MNDRQDRADEEKLHTAVDAVHKLLDTSPQLLEDENTLRTKLPGIAEEYGVPLSLLEEEVFGNRMSQAECDAFQAELEAERKEGFTFTDEDLGLTDEAECDDEDVATTASVTGTLAESAARPTHQKGGGDMELNDRDRELRDERNAHWETRQKLQEREKELQELRGRFWDDKARRVSRQTGTTIVVWAATVFWGFMCLYSHGESPDETQYLGIQSAVRGIGWAYLCGLVIWTISVFKDDERREMREREARKRENDARFYREWRAAQKEEHREP